MITRFDGTLYSDGAVEQAALVHRTDDCKRHPERLSDWPIGDLLELLLGGRWLCEREPVERALLDSLALEMKALRAALEYECGAAGEGDDFAQKFTKADGVRMLDVLSRRAEVAVLLSERLTDARRKPAPAPTQFTPGPLPSKPVTPIADADEVTP